MKDKSSTFVLAQTSYWTKIAHWSEIFGKSLMDGWKFKKFLMSFLKRHLSFSINFASLLDAIYKRIPPQWKIPDFWPEKVQRSYISCHSRFMENLKKIWLMVWKMKWEIWQIFIRAVESVKIGISTGVQSRKWMSCNLHRSYKQWHWSVMKNLKRNWLAVTKLT